MSLDTLCIAWGGYLQLRDTAHCAGGKAHILLVARGAWSTLQVVEYIQVLEMQEVLNTLTMFQEHLHHKVIPLLCDNMVVVSVIREGFSWLHKPCMILYTLHLLLSKLDLTLIL